MTGRLAAFLVVCTLTTLVWPASPVEASISWNQAIRNFQAKIRRLERQGATRDAVPANTAIPLEMTCSILGRMFRRYTEAERLEQRMDETLFLTGSADRRGVQVYWLKAWIAEVRRLLPTAERPRIRTWNYQCVAAFGVKPIGEFRPNRFYRVEDDVLIVLGDVVDGFTDQLRKALDENARITTVSLGTGGDHFVEAISAGILIRGRGLATALHADCLSACPLVFAGGVRRLLKNAAEPRLGFRGLSNDGMPIEKNDQNYLMLEEYYLTMGIDASAATWLANAEAGTIYWADPDKDICPSRFATRVSHRCNY